MPLHVNVAGVGALQADLRGASAVLGTLLQTIILRAATDKNAELADATPVRTGAAKAGWTVTAIPNGAEIVNDVFYVPFLLEGTGRRRVVVTNPNWSGMFPNAGLRARWLAAPDELQADIEASAAFAVSKLMP